jgi:heme-degrading monooxygenase HmoA
MAIAAVFNFADEPVEKYHKVFKAGGEAIINQPSRLSHVCYRTETGFTVIDIWADEQSFAAFGKTLAPAIQEAGLDAKPAVYPVEQLITKDGTRST